MFISPYRDDQKQIVILNPKGGCGKTTLATNLASYLARSGPPPILVDNDPIGYSSRWLERRPRDCCRVHGVADRGSARRGRYFWSPRMPNESGTIIVDTPAAVGRQEISELTRNADCILVPVLPSPFDIHCATKFIAELMLLTQFEIPVAVVANRTRKNTNSLAMLMRMLDNLETPTIAVLRNSQNFVQAADLGLGIFEMPPSAVKKDIEQMQPVFDWLDRLLAKTSEPEWKSLFDFRSRPNALPTDAFLRHG